MPILRTPVRLRLSGLLLLWTLGGCAGSAQELVRDADALCAVHDPKSWQGDTSNMNVIELYQEVAYRVRHAVSTDEVNAVLDGLANIEQGGFYPYMKEKITALTGEPWGCPDMERFYAAGVISIPVPVGDRVIEIFVHDTDRYSLGSRTASATSLDTLIRALGEQLQDHSAASVTITADSQQLESLQPLFDVLKARGLTKVRIVPFFIGY